MSVCHRISFCPNNQTGRETPLCGGLLFRKDRNRTPPAAAARSGRHSERRDCPFQKPLFGLPRWQFDLRHERRGTKFPALWREPVAPDVRRRRSPLPARIATEKRVRCRHEEYDVQHDHTPECGQERHLPGLVPEPPLGDDHIRPFSASPNDDGLNPACVGDVDPPPTLARREPPTVAQPTPRRQRDCRPRGIDAGGARPVS